MIHETPIPYAWEPPSKGDRGRVLVQGGKRGPDCTKDEWKAIQPRLKAAVPYVETRGPSGIGTCPRPALSARTQPHRELTKRYGKRDHLMPDVVRLRREGASWRQISERLKMPMDSARRLWERAKKA